jgi:uncharacterized protein (DUF302 family)
MPPRAFSIQPYEAKRVRVESPRPFEEVLLNLRSLVGTALPQKGNTQEAGGGTREKFEAFGEEYLDAMQALGGVAQENFEKVIQSQVGESGFMLFLELDHGKWLPIFGIQRKAVRWILGNPLIAITMMRHDITAGLFAPVELLLVENESGEGSTVIYDLPSSLMVIEPKPALLAAAHVLDQKFQALVSRVTGVELDGLPRPA